MKWYVEKEQAGLPRGVSRGATAAPAQAGSERLLYNLWPVQIDANYLSNVQ